jgi:hypothetical protein
MHLLDEGDRFWHFGDSRGYMHYAAGSRTQRSGVVVFTNGRHGLRATQPIAQLVMGGQEPIFDWIYDVFYEGKLRQWPAPAPPKPAPPRGRPARRSQRRR